VEVHARPRRATEGVDVDVVGSGFQAFGPFVKISVSYPHRAELYKARVADDTDQTNGEPGEISYTVMAYQLPTEADWERLVAVAHRRGLDLEPTEVITVPVKVWDNAERVLLAETSFEVRA
jgi:hypothetical protein